MWLGCQICSKTLRQGCTFLSSRFRGSSTGHFSNFKVKKWGKIPLLPKRQKYEWVVWSLMSQTPLLFYSWTAAVSHFLVVLFRPLRSDPGSVNIYDSRKWKKAWLWERFVHFWLTAAISKEGVRFFFYRFTLCQCTVMKCALNEWWRSELFPKLREESGLNDPTWSRLGLLNWKTTGSYFLYSGLVIFILPVLTSTLYKKKQPHSELTSPGSQHTVCKVFILYSVLCKCSL